MPKSEPAAPAAEPEPAEIAPAEPEAPASAAPPAEIDVTREQFADAIKTGTAVDGDGAVYHVRKSRFGRTWTFQRRREGQRTVSLRTTSGERWNITS